MPNSQEDSTGKNRGEEEKKRGGTGKSRGIGNYNQDMLYKKKNIFLIKGKIKIRN